MLMQNYCLFIMNFHAGIIDPPLPDAEQKLEKVRFAGEHMDYQPYDAARTFAETHSHSMIAPRAFCAEYCRALM